MRIGAVFPHNEIGNDPQVIAQWARSVEEIGFTHIMVYDHVAFRGAAPIRSEDREMWRHSIQAFHELFVLLGFLAAVTERIELSAGVLILPQRQTVLAAKQAAEVAVLSGNRLRLGVGVGWHQVEYEALGEDFTNRGRRAEEQLDLLRALWANDTVTFAGNWHTLDDTGINPRPPNGVIPLWGGGLSDAALRRAGRLGYGWLPGGAPDDAARARVEQLRRYAASAGHDPDALGIDPQVFLAQLSPEELVGFVEGWQRLGATHVSLATTGQGRTGLEHIAALEAARNRVRVIAN